MSSSLRRRIIAGNMLALFFLAALVAGFALYSTRAFLEENARREVEKRYLSITQMIEMYERNAQTHADGLAQNPSIVQAAKNRDAKALLEYTTPIMAKSRLDYLTVTDAQGFVIIRAHEPDQLIDPQERIDRQINIRQALQGKSFVGIEVGKDIKLSVRAGTPLYDHAGTLVGVISTGYILSNDEVVDNAKKMLGAEFTFFLGSERVSTTLIGADGKRMIGTTLDNPAIVRTVLQEGKTYHGSNRIDQINYNTVYGPLVDANGQIIGIIFAGVSTVTMENILESLTIRILATSLIAFILMLYANIMFTRHVTEPIHLVLEKVKEVVKLKKH